jgi:hypothetical protein
MDWRKSWVIIRERIDPEIYIERQKTSGYKPLTDDEMENLLVGEGGDNDYGDIQLEVDGKSGTALGGNEHINRKKIELYHYYGKGYVPYFNEKGEIIDKVRQDCKITVSGRKMETGDYMLISPPIPFGVKPIAIMKFKPKRGEALGRGVGAQIYDLQGELNVTRNQRMDAINFNLNQGWVITEGAVEDESELNSRMNQVIHRVDPTVSIDPIPRGNIPAETWKHEEQIKADAQLVTSSADILRGFMERKETAFTTNLRNNNAGQRLEAAIFRMANEGLRELAEVMKALLAEFTPTDNPIIARLTKDEAFKYATELGEQFNPESNLLTVGPELLKRSIYAIPCISALDGDNHAKSQMLLQLMQIMQPYLQLNPQTGMPIGWKDRSGNTVIPDVGYFIREFSRLNKMNEVNDCLIQIPNIAEQAAAQQQTNREIQLQAAKKGQVPEGNASPFMGGAPAEVAGQSMLTNAREAYNQQIGIEEALME